MFTPYIFQALHAVSNNPQPNMFGKSVEYSLFEALTPYLPFPANILTANLWLFSPIVSRLASLDNKMNSLVRTTTAITIVEAGYKVRHLYSTVLQYKSPQPLRQTCKVKHF